MYKLINDFKSGLPRAVFLISENKSIPFALDNTDYQQYLKWLDEGNTPEPAEETQ